jgi:hypothetical protein
MHLSKKSIGCLLQALRSDALTDLIEEKREGADAAYADGA